MTQKFDLKASSKSEQLASFPLVLPPPILFSCKRQINDLTPPPPKKKNKSIYLKLLETGNGNPLQYSCLENPMDRGAWWAAVHGVTQNWTQLKRLSMHGCIGEGNGNLLQCSCLENPRDRGAWWDAIYGVAQSRTWLKWLSSSLNCRAKF